MIVILDHIRQILNQPDIAIFHTFRRPPYGGSNQFLLALRRELRRRDLCVGENVIAAKTKACLLNSFAFDYARLRRMRRRSCRVVHRLDGPVSMYRGVDDGTDHRIHTINRESVDVTVLQSRYSLEKYKELGMEFTNPVIIMNAVNPSIFFPADRPLDLGNRKIRLISTSWSSNPNKGVAAYQWLDEHLNWERFEYVFVGRSPVSFKHIRMVPAVPSETVADLLRQHDIYIAASLHDPCSNALLEALACGLPAVYANSGGHPEMVGQAGLGFSSVEEVPALLEGLVGEYEARQANIRVPALSEVADQYLDAMGLRVQ